MIYSAQPVWFYPADGCLMRDMHDDDELGQPVATVAETRTAILVRAKRTFTPLRRTFVQTPRSLADNKQDLRGPLAWFVTTKNHRALQAYLLALGATSNGDGPEGWSTTHPIKVWARAFGTTEAAEPASASNAVTKIFAKLEERGLIMRGRRGRERKIRVTLLHEDGSGHAYTRPDGKTLPDRFLKLPNIYWTDGWCDKLALPALGMLLVALSEKHGFELPAEKVPAWYGWSADTAERGLAELESHGLLGKGRYRRSEPLSPTGYSIVNKYYLQPPFGSPPPDQFLLNVTQILAEFNVKDLIQEKQP